MIWTPEQDASLEEAVSRYGYDWKKIKSEYKTELDGHLLGREIKDRVFVIRKLRSKNSIPLGGFEHAPPGVDLTSNPRPSKASREAQIVIVEWSIDDDNQHVPSLPC